MFNIIISAHVDSDPDSDILLKIIDYCLKMKGKVCPMPTLLYGFKCGSFFFQKTLNVWRKLYAILGKNDSRKNLFCETFYF